MTQSVPDLVPGSRTYSLITWLCISTALTASAGRQVIAAPVAAFLHSGPSQLAQKMLSSLPKLKFFCRRMVPSELNTVPPEAVSLSKGTPACNVVLTGIVHDLSAVITWAPPAEVGMIAAVHTSNLERNKLKSSTSRLFLPSRKRTLTAFAELLVFTTDNSELYALPAPSALTV